MRKFLLIIGGVCAAAAGFLVFGARRVSPVEELAHNLQAAWSDHHTTA